MYHSSEATGILIQFFCIQVRDYGEVCATQVGSANVFLARFPRSLFTNQSLK